MHKRRLVYKLKILLPLIFVILLSGYFSFTSVVKASFDFYLPWTKGETYMCTQGINGSFSHQGKLRYAWDFGMPTGTALRASASGIVAKIEDGIPGLNRKRGWGNYVLIKHNDNTFSRYAHLQNGQIKVQKGDTVSQGEIIALSGNTGFSTGPHLHFQIEDTNRNSIQVSFIEAGIPVAGKWYTSDNGFKTKTKSRSLSFSHNPPPILDPYYNQWSPSESKVTKLASINIGDSDTDGLLLETKKKDNSIPFFEDWKGHIQKNREEQTILSRTKDIGLKKGYIVQDMVSGRFSDSHQKILAVLFKGSDKVHFYDFRHALPKFWERKFVHIGTLDTWAEVGRPSRPMHLTAGDIDRDGKDELLVSHPHYDHVRVFDGWHQEGRWYQRKTWTFGQTSHELDAHLGQVPVITDLVCMDIDMNGQDELMVATASDDHIYEYFWGEKKLHKQGYVNGRPDKEPKDQPHTRAMATVRFNGPDGQRDYLAAINGPSKEIYFYWGLDRTNDEGGILKNVGLLSSHANEAITDLAAGNFDGKPGDELALGTYGNELVHFFGEWDINREEAMGEGLGEGKVLGDQDINLYNAKLTAQSGKKILLLPNQEKELWLEYQNQGGATWFTKDHKTPDLITDNPFKRNSLFKPLSWNSSYKPTTLDNQVKPGQKAKYLFEIRAPKASKKYQEHFALYNNEKNDLYQNSKVSFEIVVDGLPPSRPKNLRPDIKNSFWAGKATSDITPTFSWEKSKDKLTEVISYLITLDNRTYTVKETSVSIPKFNCPKLSEGSHTIIVQAQDKLGNLSDPASYTFVVDVTPPEIPQNLGPDTLESQWVGFATSDTKPTFIWEKSSDSLTGVSGYYITLDEKSYSLDSSITSWICPDLEEGNHTLTLKAKDKVNNISDVVSYTFIVDASDPEPPENLEPETEDSQWYTNITSDTIPTFKWEEGSDVYSGLDGYNVQIDSNSQYQISDIQSWKIPSELSEGEHTISIASRDKLGHLSDSVSYSFVIDISSPEGSIAINQEPEGSIPQFTNSQDVALTIEALDVSPIVEYSISNDNISWTSYQLSTDNNQLSTNIDWTLPDGDGTKTVYVKFKDIFSQISSSYSSSIILDQTNPTSYINDLPAFHNTLSFLVSWFGLDNLSGIKWFDIQVKDSLTNVWRNWLTGTNLISKIFQGLDGVTYWFRSRAQDLAGNQEEYSDQPDTETKVDTTAPEPPTINLPERNVILNASFDVNLDMEGIQVKAAGTAEANSDIQLTIGSQLLTAKADQDGQWSISDVTLAEGANKLEAKSTDAAGNWNTSGEHLVWLDTIAPSAISDLAAADVTYHSLIFSWTAPGDDENQGTAKEYDIRYSTLEINKDNFESAAQVVSPPVPEEAGTVQTLTLDNLESKQTYFIAIKTKDDGQNWSEISNIASDTTATSANSISMVSSESTLVAEGVEQTILTITVKDPNGKTGPKLSGEPVKIAISETNGVPDNTGTLSPVTDNNKGAYTATYATPTKVGNGQVTLTALCNTCMITKEDSLNVKLISGNPAGTINLNASPSQVNANGSSVSTITSDIITDATGNTVADDQKITIWLDNTEAGYITTQDQNPGTPGIQIKVSSGKITFQVKSKPWNGYGEASKLANAKAKSVKGSASGSVQITFKDVVAPSAPLITQPGNGIITNNKNVTIAGKSEKKSRVLLYKNNSYWYYRYADSNGNWSWTKSMGDGTYTLKAGARDTAGNPNIISNWSNSRTFTVDTQKPAITLNPLSPDPNNDSTPRFTGQAVDSRTKIIDIEYKVDSGSWKNVPSFTPAINVSFAFTLNLGDGGHTVYVRSKDQAGNWSNSASDSFTIDTQKPTVTLNSLSPDPNNDNTPKFTGKAVDSRTKIVQIQYKVDSSSWRNISFSQSTNVSFSFTTFSLSDGGHTVYVRSKDQAGNWSSQAQDSFTIDTKKPTIYGFSPANNVTLYHRTVAISANYSDSGSGINTSTAKMKIKVDSGSWQDVTSSCSRTSSKISYTKKWTQENHSYTVYVEVKDKAGNIQSASWKFKIQVVSRYKSKRDSNHRVWRIQPWDYPNVGQVTEPPAPRNWNSLNFNDSAWGLPYDLGNCNWISGAKWLWNDSHPDISETMLLRFAFNLPNIPGLKVADATIKIAIDDATWAYVSGSANEQLFAQQTMGQNPHSYWIKPHLKPGKNVLAFQVSNLNYDTGFINAGLGYELKVVYEDGP